MKATLRSLTILILCLWMVSPLFAQLPASAWKSDGLIAELTLSDGWRNGTITLSQSLCNATRAFDKDHAKLQALHYKIPVTMVISVDELIKKDTTIILHSKELSYNVVLRYDPKTQYFNAVWFDRDDVEIPTESYQLVKIHKTQ